ncbi:saccharopine dehydrogenase family protein [Streptomyces sp. AK02-01A]|uniref:saccharopine dehydrogenase family protein n=1 Tax=Streptomyces sp. AK02-01A TaxID=3028648 RepID=UPI0029A0A8C6|nr:saccharopine dehydrogenase NADP-binding domain-containing protein [Streptomyces sp. AK02-01A]MDX3854890.1 saccharopine dehydrogenase NADP-binding domain-containing protein [Streptomyces sp. AK02-01A]
MNQISEPVIAVFGATGHTGKFVVAELLNRGLTPIPVARNSQALAAADFGSPNIISRQAIVDDPAALDRAVRGAQLVINCAGPFANTAHAVATAAIRAGAHYMDICAEQKAAQEILEFFDKPARRENVAVVPAMAFYGGFADLLTVAALGEWDSADAVDILIGLDSWHPTIGSRNTMNTVGRQVIAGGQLVPASSSVRKRWSFEEPFGEQILEEMPFSEIILISRHLKASEIHNYLSQVALDDARDPSTPPPEGIDARGRSAQRFIVEAVVTRDGEQRRASARGQDSYSATASMIGEAAERLLRARDVPAGTHTPGELFKAADFLAALDLESFVRG